MGSNESSYPRGNNTVPMKKALIEAHDAGLELLAEFLSEASRAVRSLNMRAFNPCTAAGQPLARAAMSHLCLWDTSDIEKRITDVFSDQSVWSTDYGLRFKAFEQMVVGHEAFEPSKPYTGPIPMMASYNHTMAFNRPMLEHAYVATVDKASGQTRYQSLQCRLANTYITLETAHLGRLFDYRSMRDIESADVAFEIRNDIYFAENTTRYEEEVAKYGQAEGFKYVNEKRHEDSYPSVHALHRMLVGVSTVSHRVQGAFRRLDNMISKRPTQAMAAEPKGSEAPSTARGGEAPAFSQGVLSVDIGAESTTAPDSGYHLDEKKQYSDLETLCSTILHVYALMTDIGETVYSIWSPRGTLQGKDAACAVASKLLFLVDRAFPENPDIPLHMLQEEADELLAAIEADRAEENKKLFLSEGVMTNLEGARETAHFDESDPDSEDEFAPRSMGARHIKMQGRPALSTNEKKDPLKRESKFLSSLLDIVRESHLERAAGFLHHDSEPATLNRNGRTSTRSIEESANARAELVLLGSQASLGTYIGEGVYGIQSPEQVYANLANTVTGGLSSQEVTAGVAAETALKYANYLLAANMATATEEGYEALLEDFIKKIMKGKRDEVTQIADSSGANKYAFDSLQGFLLTTIASRTLESGIRIGSERFVVVCPRLWGDDLPMRNHIEQIHAQYILNGHKCPTHWSANTKSLYAPTSVGHDSPLAKDMECLILLRLLMGEPWDEITSWDRERVHGSILLTEKGHYAGRQTW